MTWEGYLRYIAATIEGGIFEMETTTGDTHLEPRPDMPRLFLDTGYHEIDSLFEGIDYLCSLARALVKDPCMDYYANPLALWSRTGPSALTEQ